MKKLFTILMIALVAFTSTSCDKYLDVNKNVDSPDEQVVPAYLYLAGVLGYFTAQYWDCRGLMPLVQYTGTSGNGYYWGRYHTYIAASDYMGEIWKMTFWTQGKNTENLINKAIEAEQWHMAGIGYAIKANSWDMLTKEYGDAPMTQAFEPGRLKFDYDTQEDIYTAVREWAYKAIESLEMDDKTSYGSQWDYDVMYHGDIDKWKKFAYGVIVRNLSSLTNKSDFTSKYADELIACAKLSLASADDDAAVEVGGGGADATKSAYNNFFGAYRGNLTNTYWQHDYITALLSGTVVEYTTANPTERQEMPNYKTSRWRYEFGTQYIADTTLAVGTYDPRVNAKLATQDDPNFNEINDRAAVQSHYYLGGNFTGKGAYNTGGAAPYTNAPNLFGLQVAVNNNNSGSGRWLFRDEAPYILMTAAEIHFCMAEAYFRKGDKANALAAFKKAVSLDMDFTEKYLKPGSAGKANEGGDKISKALFRELANEYLAGPYVGGLSTGDLTLSHIMLQKYVALFPWGALETWVDQRKVWYDIAYTGDYPYYGNGWADERVEQKLDDDATKVYKGYYFVSSKVDTRQLSINYRQNNSAPAFRIRGRYNSEYMWNKEALKKLKPIPAINEDGTEVVNYMCSPMWFQFPGDVPETLNY